MQTCKAGEMNPDWLYHVTSTRNVASILEKGLLPELSEFTVEAVFNNRSEEMGMDWDDPEAMCMTGEELDLEKESLYADIQENTPEMVFAAELDYLPTILYMMTTNPISNIPMDEIAVVAIKGCKAQFEEKEVASPVDWVSTKAVPPDCIEVVPRECWAHLLERRRC